jgi:hypothetical protein
VQILSLTAIESDSRGSGKPEVRLGCMKGEIEGTLDWHIAFTLRYEGMNYIGLSAYYLFSQHDN